MEVLLTCQHHAFGDTELVIVKEKENAKKEYLAHSDLQNCLVTLTASERHVSNPKSLRGYVSASFRARGFVKQTQA